VNAHPPSLSAESIAELGSIVGKENVVTDPEALGVYGQDETEDLFFPPEVILRPSTTGQVSAILALANARRIPVTPRGGGTGLSGGALPVRGGICLSMEKFNRILEIDPLNLQAVAEPGVVT
jgi:glycolate oxidase